MKKIIFAALALLIMGSQVEVNAQKKEKKAKEPKAKKELKWDWDGTLSGNETIDKYLLEIDTLYNRVQTYKDSIGSYDLKFDTLFINEKVYVMSHMEDTQGNLVSRAQVNWQCAEAYTQGANIILDMTNAGLGSATAALELPSLGLKALQFGKYVKGGPAVISQGTKAIKDVRGKWMKNSRDWKSMKDGAIDASAIGYTGFNEAILKKLNKCYYVKQMQEDDPYYSETIKRFTGKTPEEIAAENEAIAQQIAQAAELPEDKAKRLDDLPDMDDEEA